MGEDSDGPSRPHHQHICSTSLYEVCASPAPSRSLLSSCRQEVGLCNDVACHNLAGDRMHLCSVVLLGSSFIASIGENVSATGLVALSGTVSLAW